MMRGGGAKQSAPLANLLTAVVLKEVGADLKAEALGRKLPEPAPTLMGYAVTQTTPLAVAIGI